MNDIQKSENKNANNNVDVLYKIWLGLWFVVQLFEGDQREIERDIREIRSLLDEDLEQDEATQ